MTEIFAGMGVAEMQLHKGNRHAKQCIPECNGGVGVRAGIDQDSLAQPHGLMDAFHEGPFEVALETIQFSPLSLGLLSKSLFDRCQFSVSVDPWLPLSQQIEVGSVQQQQMHGRRPVSIGPIVSIRPCASRRLVSSCGVVRVGARVVNGGGL